MNLFRRTQRTHQPSVSASRARRPRRQRLGIEALEGRQLLSLGPPDIVNTNPRNNEFGSANASNDNGLSVVAWVDSSSTNIHDIYAQMFNPDGTKRGLQIQVAFSNLSHNEPAVAMDAKGDFVVAYTEGPDNNSTIVAKRYNNLGQQIGGPVAGVSVGGPEFDPSVAMDLGGNFVITYTQVGHQDQIVGRQFDSSGRFVRPLAVDDFNNNNNDSQARVAMDIYGDFAIAWTKQNLTTKVQEIDLARFEVLGTQVVLLGSGAAVTGASPALSNGFDRVSAPSLAVAASGSMELAYEFNDGGANGGSSSIGAQRFDFFSGIQSGPPILIQANTATVVIETSLASVSDGATDGAFVVGYPIRGGFNGNGQFNTGGEVTVVDSLDNGNRIMERHTLFFALNQDKVSVSSDIRTDNYLVSYTAHDFNNSNNFNIYREIGQPFPGPAAKNLALTPTVQVGQLAHLTGSLTDAAGNTNLTLTVNWGDGSKPDQSKPGLKPFDVTHKYLKPGIYKVHATWSDNHGLSNSRDLSITVKPAPKKGH
jgi:hypothetical protein